MRFLFLVFAISYWGPVFAQDCMNWIAQSEVQKAINLEPNAGAKKCGGDDPCVCFDGIDWNTAKYADVEVDDHSKPKFKKAYNVVSCADKSEKECAQMVEHPEFCTNGDQGFYRRTGKVLEGYCTSVVGYEKSVQKVLEVDAVKVQAKVDAEALAKSEREKKQRELTSGLALCRDLDEKSDAQDLISCVKTLSKMVQGGRLEP